MTSAFLGISAFYHDSAATLVVNGRVVAAAQEERFTRRRHDRDFPHHAVRWCLESVGLSLRDLTAVVYHEDPKLKYDRVRNNFRAAGPGAYDAFVTVMPEWHDWKRDIVSHIEQTLADMYPGETCEVRSSTHHRSHAASAFLPSPYEEAAVLTIDGVGEWETTSIWAGRGTSMEKLASIDYPHSLGFLYSAVTQYCGFKVDSGEYKLMGLAPYGSPHYASEIRRHLIDLKKDGSFELNVDLFEFVRGHQMIGADFESVFGRPSRRPENTVEQFHCDMAASVQQVTEEAVLGLARTCREMTGMDRLVMAGGVALNCVANGVLDRAGVFEEVWIQPAAGDAGCSLGAALDAAVQESAARVHLTSGRDAMAGALLGPSYEPAQIAEVLESFGAAYVDCGDDIAARTAEQLAEGKVVGWFQGRMEFGPRALGARSILGDPRSAEMQRTMNLKIKYRESFRPFAPAVLESEAADYFEVRSPSPSMLLVSPVRPELHRGGKGTLGSINEVRSTIPAVTHVDYSARVQTVNEHDNAAFHALLTAFREATGCPVLVNTSFNVRGEPIVMSPEHAYTCFMRTEMDVLVLGPYLLMKKDQPPFRDPEADWRSAIALD
ncbi:carbamoyltransferase family protein [Dermacoccus abyssi]